MLTSLMSLTRSNFYIETFLSNSICDPAEGVCEQGGQERFQCATSQKNVLRFRGGLVFKAHRLCVSLNSRLASNKAVERSERGR